MRFWVKSKQISGSGYQGQIRLLRMLESTRILHFIRDHKGFPSDRPPGRSFWGDWPPKRSIGGSNPLFHPFCFFVSKTFDDRFQDPQIIGVQTAGINGGAHGLGFSVGFNLAIILEPTGPIWQWNPSSRCNSGCQPGKRGPKSFQHGVSTGWGVTKPPTLTLTKPPSGGILKVPA